MVPSQQQLSRAQEVRESGSTARSGCLLCRASLPVQNAVVLGTTMSYSVWQADNSTEGQSLCRWWCSAVGGIIETIPEEQRRIIKAVGAWHQLQKTRQRAEDPEAQVLPAEPRRCF